MNRGDVKLMHDQLVQVGPLSISDAQIVDRACNMLLELADALHAARQETEMGKRMCGQLMAEIGDLNDAQIARRIELAKYREREKTMGWNQS